MCCNRYCISCILRICTVSVVYLRCISVVFQSVFSVSDMYLWRIGASICSVSCISGGIYGVSASYLSCIRAVFVSYQRMYQWRIRIILVVQNATCLVNFHFWVEEKHTQMYVKKCIVCISIEWLVLVLYLQSPPAKEATAGEKGRKRRIWNNQGALDCICNVSD